MRYIIECARKCRLREFAAGFKVDREFSFFRHNSKHRLGHSLLDPSWSGGVGERKRGMGESRRGSGSGLESRCISSNRIKKTSESEISV